MRHITDALVARTLILVLVSHSCLEAAPYYIPSVVSQRLSRDVAFCSARSLLVLHRTDSIFASGRVLALFARHVPIEYCIDVISIDL